MLGSVVQVAFDPLPLTELRLDDPGSGRLHLEQLQSQRRAEAIREALINPFGISPARLEAVGLGEEQLLKPSNPDAAENRRVQLIALGKL